MNLYLAPLDSSDMGMVRNWRNRYEIWRWCRQDDLISDAAQIRWFNRQSEDPTIKMYKVMIETLVQEKDKEPETKAHAAGVCGLTSIDLKNRRAEFSLYLAPELHGKGFGKIALKTLLLHGFQNLGMNVIYGETFDSNPAARMFEKLGFRKEGTRRQFYFRDGRFIDAHLYSITSEEFHAHCASDLGGSQPDRGEPVPVAPVQEPGPEGSVQPDQCVGAGSPDEAGCDGAAEAHGEE